MVVSSVDEKTMNTWGPGRSGYRDFYYCCDTNLAVFFGADFGNEQAVLHDQLEQKPYY
jgi:hypothetical protein